MFSFTDINNTFSQMVSLDNLQNLIEGTPAAPQNTADNSSLSHTIHGNAASKFTVSDVVSNTISTIDKAVILEDNGGLELQLASEIVDLRSALKSKSTDVIALQKDLENMQQALHVQSQQFVTIRKEKDDLLASNEDLSQKLEKSLQESRDLALRLSSVNDSNKDSISIEIDPVLKQRLDTFELKEANDIKKIEKLETKIESLTAELGKLQEVNTKSSRDFNQSFNQLEKSKGEVEKNVELLTQQLTTSNEQIQERDQTIESNISLLQASNREIERLNESLRDLQKKLQIQEEGSIANQEGYKKDIEDMKSTHQADISSKDHLITDLQGKITALTDKLKDVMKKFADLKSKNQVLDGAEEKSNDLSRQLQHKESEILSLKLKFENLERTSGDTRVLSAELTEKYGDAQREILKLRNKLQEDNNVMASLRKDTESLKVDRDRLLSENASSSEYIQELQSLNATMLLSHHREVSEIKSSYDREIQEHLEKITTIQSENRFLQSRAKDDEEMATILEEYKKRAQNALKKANSASASIAAEKAEMQKIIDEVIGKAKIAEEFAMNLKQELEIALSTCQENEFEISKLRNQITKLQSEQLAESARCLSPSVEEAADYFNVDDKLVSDNQHQSCDDMSESTQPTKTVARTSQEQAPNDSIVAYANDIDSNPPAVPVNPDESMHNSFVFPHRGIPHSSLNLEASEDIEIGSGVNLHIEKPSSEQLVYINELYGQLDELRKEMSQKCIHCDMVEQELQSEKDAKRKLATRVDELKAFLERTKKLQDGPDAVINLEYLKNCIFKFMSSTEHSEKKRLYPVISMILKLTGEEKNQIENALAGEDEAANVEFIPISSIGAIATTSFESIFGKTSFFSNSSDA